MKFPTAVPTQQPNPNPQMECTEHLVYRTHIHCISHFKACLIDERQMFNQKIIDWALSNSGVHVGGHVFKKVEDTSNMSYSQTVCCCVGLH